MLNIERSGQGQPVVVIHGWGFDARVMAPLCEALAQQYEVHAVDLPGFGQSPAQAGLVTLEDLAAWMAPQLPVGAVYIGWSLGGVVATQLVHREALAAKALVTIASTPHFLAADDWPGMPAVEWRAFKAQLRKQPVMLWRNFYRQLGCNGPFKALCRKIYDRPKPSVATLAQALAWLATDVRHLWGGVDAPCPHESHWGTQDRIVPHATLRHLPTAVQHRAYSWVGGHDVWYGNDVMVAGLLGRMRAYMQEASA